MANVKDLLVNGSARVIGTIYGNATSANKLNTNAGSTTQPVYFNNGVPVGITGSIANSTTGNAATATKLATARNFKIGSTSKSFNGTADVTWTHAEIGATVSNAWTSGTTNGPTLSTTVNGITGTAVAIPSASASTSGVVTTRAQTFAGDKTFTGSLNFDYTGSTKASNTMYHVGTIAFKNASNSVTYSTPWFSYIGTDGTDGWNTALRFGSTSGTTWITAGESGAYLPQALSAFNDEHLYLSADNEIKMYTSCANDATSYKLSLRVAGDNVYATNFNGKLIGNADTATALTTSAGSATQPIYFSNGKPVAITGTIANSISGNAATATNSDTVDGYHADRFFIKDRLGSTATAGDDGLWGVNGTRCFHNALPESLSGIYPWGQLISFSSECARLQFYSPHTASTNDGLSYRSGWNSDKKQWVRILDSNNYNNWVPKKDGTGASGNWGISITGNAASASKVNNKLTFGTKTYDGSAAVTLAASDLGLASAMLFLGTTTTAITDGAKTNPVAIGGSNKTVTAGNVVLYGSKEFVWTGSVWEELGNEGSYKIVQAAVADPAASGTSNTFIATISQDANGKITATKKTVAVTNSAPTLAWGTTSTIGSVAGTNLQVTMPANPNVDTKVTQTITTSNAAYPLLLAPNGQTATTTTTSYFDSGVTLNPSTNTIAANISGNAATATKATQDGWGNVITSSYLYREYKLDRGNQYASADNLRSCVSFAYDHQSAPSTGTIVTFDYLGNEKYSLQLMGSYLNTNNNLYFRNRDGDNDKWGSWRTVLDDSNYMLYAAPLGGKGAFGTWGISITGNASTATKATGSYALREEQKNKTVLTTFLDTSSNIHRTNEQGEMNLYRFFASDDPSNYSTTYGYPAIDNHVLAFSIDSGTAWERLLDFDIRSTDIYTRAKTSGAWGSWVKLLDSNNYTNYVPTKTGSGASGTWGISVTGSSASCTGNSATATKLATTRTISLTGSVTGSGNFDGSGNLSISTTTNHDHGMPLYTFVKDLQVTTDWMDVGISGSNLSTGSYIVYMGGWNSGQCGFWGDISTGYLSWYEGGTNSSDYDEILLHTAGHATNGGHIYLRTLRSPNPGYLKLQIRSDIAATAVSSITFKFRKVI